MEKSTRCLTPRQLDIIQTVYEYRLEYGYSPSYDEIAESMSTHKTTVFGHVRSLIEKGVLMKVSSSPTRNLIVHPDLVRFVHGRKKTGGLREAAQTLVMAAVKNGSDYILTEEEFDSFCQVLRSTPDLLLDDHLDRIRACPPGPLQR